MIQVVPTLAPFPFVISNNETTSSPTQVLYLSLKTSDRRVLPTILESLLWFILPYSGPDYNTNKIHRKNCTKASQNVTNDKKKQALSISLIYFL